jgi:signal transduction histidine kinase
MATPGKGDPAQGAGDAARQRLLTAAHEIRGPLGVAAGYIDVIASGGFGELPDTAREPLAIAQRKIGEVDALIEEILLRDRLAAEPSLRARVDARELIGAALRRARPRARLQRGSLDGDLPETPVPVAADPVQVSRVLDNLINNALTYSAGPPWVHVELRGGDARAEIRVADRGVGIAKRDRRRIFGRFQRAGADAADDTHGTGLGLAIARQMAEANGGSLELEESAPGRGSRFLLTLPLAGA